MDPGSRSLLEIKSFIFQQKIDEFCLTQAKEFQKTENRAWLKDCHNKTKAVLSLISGQEEE